MRPTSHRWTTITPSAFAWEQEALDVLRLGLPDHEPYRAWSNFELVAGDGSINEVDALVVVPAGIYLVEIKSFPGALRGDGNIWTRSHGGHEQVIDNPRLRANLKAKRLKSMLQGSKAFKQRTVPFVEAVVFLSATDLSTAGLDPAACAGTLVRPSGTEVATPIPGLQPLWSWTPKQGGLLGATTAKAVADALAEIGIRPSQRQRQIGDYRLEELLDDRGSWQDWRAKHVSLPGLRRRVRIYHTTAATGSETRATLSRAAKREIAMLQGIDHPGIVRPVDYTEHELGPALFFEDPSRAQRLDRYLTEHGDRLSFWTRLHLLRSLAEIFLYAHRRRLVHRALEPRCVLVLDPEAEAPHLAVSDWHAGGRDAGSTTGHAVTATIHPGLLVDDEGGAYMAPEVRTHLAPDGVLADVFSLGAIAYRLFTGRAPAGSHFELVQRLQEQEHLDISAAVDGCPVALDLLVTEATHADADRRCADVDQILVALDQLEEELTAPEVEIPDPETARAGETFPGGYLVKRRLGQGSTSFVFLVEKGSDERVLKIARTTSHNQVLQQEAEVLEKLRHQNIVELFGVLEIGDRVALELARAGTRTLAEELRQVGRLSLDFLERFGEDLLEIVRWLEEKGLSHRDLKPENLGIQAVGPKDAKHLVLFDFSLSRAAVERIELGTPAYLDPFLRDKSRRRFDLAAERFAAAMTLHEMATGQLPGWGSGAADPLFAEGEVRLEPELFYPAVRAGLAAFFARALARQASTRFDNAEEMLRAWRKTFQTLDEVASKAVAPATEGGEVVRLPALESAERETPIADLGLSTRAFHALERLGAETAEQLVALRPGQLSRMRGVGQKTRAELVATATCLRKRFGTVRATPAATETESGEEATAGIDALAARLVPSRPGRQGARDEALRLFLGLAEAPRLPPRPNQSQVAESLRLTRARVSQLLVKARERWRKTPALTSARADVATLLELRGGLMEEGEVATALLNSRGAGSLPLQEARAAARAVVRAATEAERQLAAPRWALRRGEVATILARVVEDDDEPLALAAAGWALALGAAADQLAAEDPLPSPEGAVAALQRIPPPADWPPLDDARLVRLAAACSQTAAVSSRRELYPRGLDAGRALRLAAGVAQGVGGEGITVEQLLARVAARYPEAESLPGRPRLDALLVEAGLELRWDPDAREGSGTYTERGHHPLLSSTGTFSHLTRTPRPAPPPETLEAEALERRLARAAERGTWLLLVSRLEHLSRAQELLLESFPLQHASLDRLLLEEMHRAALELGVEWPVVLAADAASRDSRAWQNLLRLVEHALPAVEERLLATEGTVLLSDSGLLGRYERLDLLERLRDRLARPEPGRPLRGLWTLVPTAEQGQAPRIHGRPVPVVGPSEWAEIPRSWLEGAHRAVAP